MCEQNYDTSPSNELVQDATQLIIRKNAVSVSMLQRQYRLGHLGALGLAKALERNGIITQPSDIGTRQLTSEALAMRVSAMAPSSRELFERWGSDPFEGGDGGDRGSREAPSIWVFGIEHGDALNIEQEASASNSQPDYSIEKQLEYKYNQQAFKLLAATHGVPSERFEAFARHHQIWVPGSKGFLKGNLYPFPARKVELWSRAAVSETGFDLKANYVSWCNQYRIPAIAKAVQKYRPRLFIGVGNSFVREFSRAYFGAEVSLQIHQFTDNGRIKRIHYANHNGGRFVVIPHLSYYSNCLNSDMSIQIAGSFIAGLMN